MLSRAQCACDVKRETPRETSIQKKAPPRRQPREGFDRNRLTVEPEGCHHFFDELLPLPEVLVVPLPLPEVEPELLPLLEP